MKFEEVEDGEEYEGTSHQYYDGDYTMEEVTLLRKLQRNGKGTSGKPSVQDSMA